jgi:hypothetical protein
MFQNNEVDNCPLCSMKKDTRANICYSCWTSGSMKRVLQFDRVNTHKRNICPACRGYKANRKASLCRGCFEAKRDAPFRAPEEDYREICPSCDGPKTVTATVCKNCARRIRKQVWKPTPPTDSKKPDVELGTYPPEHQDGRCDVPYCNNPPFILVKGSNNLCFDCYSYYRNRGRVPSLPPTERAYNWDRRHKLKKYDRRSRSTICQPT